MNAGQHIPSLYRLKRWRSSAWVTLSSLDNFCHLADKSFLFCFTAENYLVFFLTGIFLLMQGCRQARLYLIYLGLFFIITGGMSCPSLPAYSFIPMLTKSGSLLQAFIFSRSMRKNVKLLIHKKEVAWLRAEEAAEARKKAESANRAKSEFLANMSHDIRTPMNAVIGFSELLADMQLDERQQSCVRAIRSGGENLLSLINDILDLSKIEAKKMDSHPEPIRIRTLLDEIRQLFSLKIKKKQLNLYIEVADTVPALVVLDGTQLRRILFNLIGNAVKFTRKGHIRIRVHNDQPGNKEKILLMLQVEDTGPGIRADLHETLFHPFQQDSTSSEQHAGTGLGLTITRHLAELMNGDIALQNRAGGGSIFTVRFFDVPITETAQPDRQSPDEQSDRIVFANLTILIADDLQEHRDLLKGFLADMQIRLVEAKNGQEAVALARHHHPNVILLDIRMPMSDGYEAARQIKKDKKLCRIPIIAVTAFALQQDQEKIMADGLFDGFLAKPIQQASLFRELARFLPYTEALKKEEAAQSAPCPTEVPQDVSLLIRQLEEELRPLWQEACRTKIFSDIERFADRTRTVGQEYSCTLLINYGKNLKIHSCNFAVEKMKEVLYAYPDLFEQLTATQQHIEKKKKKEESTDGKNTNTDC